MSLPDKAELRSTLRSRRRALPTSDRKTRSQAIARHAGDLPGWERAKHCALYLDSDGEVPTAALAESCRKAGKQLWLPVIIEDKRLAFARWDADTELVSNRYGIPEPAAGTERRALEAMDIVFLPLVAWDTRGSRLGMGGGYYDRSLAAAKGELALKVGLAYTFQEVPELPREAWDQSLDFILTENGVVETR